MELTEHSTSPSNKIKSTKHLAGPAKKEESTQTSASPSYKMKSTKHLASPSALSSVSPAKTRNCIVQSNRRGQLKRKSSEVCATDIKSTLYDVISMYIARKILHHQRNVIVEGLRTGQWKRKLTLYRTCQIPSKTY